MAVAVCNNTRNYRLTVGRSYEIIATEGNRIVIANDRGTVVRYATELFTIQEEGTATMHQERPEPTPEPVPEPVNESRPATEREAIESISVNNDSVVVKHTINTIDTDVTESFDINYNIDDTEISCGVKQFSGINAICNTISSFVNNNYDDDYVDLRKAILRAIITDVQNQRSDFQAFMLISTAIHNIEDYYIQVLDALCNTFTTVERNPNSGNQIKVWVM